MAACAGKKKRAHCPADSRYRCQSGRRRPAPPPPTAAVSPCSSAALFFFNDTATTEISTLSLHDALPISLILAANSFTLPASSAVGTPSAINVLVDRKSTRLNCSHITISYAVFCMKKKKKNTIKIYNTKKKKKQILIIKQRQKR